MNTKFPYKKVDFEKALNNYFQREDAITALPTPEEMRENAIKAIVKEHIALVSQPAGTCAERGDTLTLKTVSSLPKFNKPKVTVSIGRGLYDKGLEAAMVGKKVGDTCTVTEKEQNVEVTVLEIKRKMVPAPTDEMVVALQAKDFENKIITTADDYIAFVMKEKELSTLANINYYVMEEILKAYPIEAYDEDDIRILGELEHDAFRKIFLEREGVDLDALSPEQLQEKMNVRSFAEFMKMRYDWYKMKIQQCCVFASILGIPLEGKYDPTSRYEVLSDLTNLMYERIKEELNRRNG